jgi:hypothetical protein
MRNTADVTGGKPIAVWSHFMSGVCEWAPYKSDYNFTTNIQVSVSVSNYTILNELRAKVTKWGDVWPTYEMFSYRK